MDPTKKFTNLKFKSASDWLIKLSNIEVETTNYKIDPKVQALRTNKLRKWKQSRELAIFCYGLSSRYGYNIDISNEEDIDFDGVARWIDKDTQIYTPVQLKEIVPKKLNKKNNLQEVVNSLTIYSGQKDLVVAIYVNRDDVYDFKKLLIPNLKIAQLWFFGAISKDRQKWFLYGDLISKPNYSEYNYPN